MNLYKVVDQNGKQVFDDLLIARQVTEKDWLHKEQRSPGSSQFRTGEQEIPDHSGGYQIEQGFRR